MHIKIPHKLRKYEAVARVQKALNAARSHMGKDVQMNEEKWTDNVLHFDLTAQGKRVTGTLTVEDSNFTLDAKLPLMWRLFEGRIEKEIAEQIRHLS